MHLHNIVINSLSTLFLCHWFFRSLCWICRDRRSRCMLTRLLCPNSPEHSLLSMPSRCVWIALSHKTPTCSCSCFHLLSPVQTILNSSPWLSSTIFHRYEMWNRGPIRSWSLSTRDLPIHFRRWWCSMCLLPTRELVKKLALTRKRRMHSLPPWSGKSFCVQQYFMSLVYGCALRVHSQLFNFLSYCHV